MSSLYMRSARARVGCVGTLLLALTACGGGGGSSTTAATTPSGTYAAKSGVAQKGPLIKGSTVTAQELDSNLSPTGTEYTYQTTSDLGTFSPTSSFKSQYIGLVAAGYYFDEVIDSISSGPVTLNAYSDLAIDSVLNVNLLTTLEYQRIQNLVTQSKMTFEAARAQAETEVLAALNIPSGSYGSFDSLDLSGNSDGDHILEAISALFVYGNTAGTLSQLIANFQSDIGANGVLTNSNTAATLIAAAEQLNTSAVAANLTQFYSSDGLSFTATSISDWIAQSGDGIIGRFAFMVSDATPSTVFTFPSYVVSQFAGTSVAVTAGQLSINGTPVNGTVSFNAGDVVTLSPFVGSFPSGVLPCYLVSGKKKLARVSFVSNLMSITVTPNMPNVPLGLTQQFTATGTFSDTSTADLTTSVTWASGNSAVAGIGVSTGLANALAVGSTLISATSGSVSGSTTLSVTPAALESIVITPNPVTIGVGLSQQLSAEGFYSDGTTQNVTTLANWSSGKPSVATVGPSTGAATGVSVGSATISATIGSITGTAPLSVITNAWLPTGNLTTFRMDHTATLLPDGTVLAAGGQQLIDNTTWQYLASAEIYNPVAESWTATGSMTVPRDYHTATLLPNGKVLVAGGMNSVQGTVIIATAEIYDPATGTWAATGSMSTGRINHTATLLANGTVLVAGGQSDAGMLASAEIYNPATGTWTVTGSMTNTRTKHTATLLPSGMLLAAGGQTDDINETATAEIFNPSAGTWTVTGSMITARGSAAATLLPNGKVLAAGGYNLNIAGTLGGALASAEIYDPVAGTWTATGNLTTPRNQLTVTLLPAGTVLAAGGFNVALLASAEIYDPAAGTWRATASMSTERTAHTATLLSSGTVLAAGGDSVPNSVNTSSTAEIYDDLQ